MVNHTLLTVVAMSSFAAAFLFLTFSLLMDVQAGVIPEEHNAVLQAKYYDNPLILSFFSSSNRRRGGIQLTSSTAGCLPCEQMKLGLPG